MSCTKSEIAWTNRTHNFFRGCTIKDKGCLNCYAMMLAASGRLGGPGKAYEGLTQISPRGPIWNGAIRLAENALDEPQHWRQPSMIFSNSMSDWQHRSIADEDKERLLQSYLKAPWHVYQFLTKREDVQQVFFKKRKLAKLPALPPNFHIGVSVTHKGVLHRLNTLRRTPGISMRWASFEPLIEDLGASLDLSGLNWVVVGGESEHRLKAPARPMHTAWAARVITQAQRQSVPVFLKQHGRWVSVNHLPPENLKTYYRTGQWLTASGQWTNHHETPKRRAWAGGCDLMVKSTDQAFALWYGQLLQEWPRREFYPPNWPT